MKLHYTQTAVEDLESAITWYNQQRSGLGLEFLSCVESAIKLIINNPQLYFTSYSNYRACLIRRFPFSIIYTIETNSIIVQAVFDNRQNPKKRP